MLYKIEDKYLNIFLNFLLMKNYDDRSFYNKEFYKIIHDQIG